MENNEHLGLSKLGSPEVVPSLIKFIAANEVAGFDRVEEPKNLDIHHQQTGFQFFSSSATVSFFSFHQIGLSINILLCMLIFHFFGCLDMSSIPIDLHS